MAGRTFIEAWSLSFSDFEFIQTCTHATRVAMLLQFLRRGDALVVTRVDRHLDRRREDVL